MPASGQRAQCLLEGVGEGVLGEGDVARSCAATQREQPSRRTSRAACSSRRAGVARSVIGSRSDVHAPSTKRVADGADLDGAPVRPRAPCRAHSMRGVEVGHLDHERAAELLLGVGERAVLHDAASPSTPRDGRRSWRTAGAPRRRREDAGGVERLRVVVERRASPRRAPRGRGRRRSSRGSAAGVRSA